MTNSERAPKANRKLKLGVKLTPGKTILGEKKGLHKPSLLFSSFPFHVHYNFHPDF
jgi:hypothetical protein